ncbi:hypothetical protein Galf_0599 [Gallionella capsiferriformans ES-2]|uniref:Uncharacterized protein n=1 Tax=Gallionella capsiferriformans (strain ES-2) TaxID=395494 RepID=D9SCV2_GALCS|nr:hypothetical protein Galf_0599 [Gallionella capsiferriformans ES-2]
MTLNGQTGVRFAGKKIGSHFQAANCVGYKGLRLINETESLLC